MKIAQFYCLLAVYTYMGLSKSGAELAVSVSDKLLHFSGYVIFIISAMIAYRMRHGLIFILLFAYSVLIEIIQYFLPYRTFEVMDIPANLSGLVAGSLLWLGGKHLIMHIRGVPKCDLPADEQR